MLSALGGEILKFAVTLGEIEDRAICRDGGTTGYYK